MNEGMILDRLGQLEPDWTDVEARSTRLGKQRLRRAMLTAGVVAAAAILAAGAYAAARTIWPPHDMTPADIDRQATVVTSECDGQGQCTPVRPSHREVNIVPSMGVVFVLPDGDSTSVVPALAIWNIPAAGGPPSSASHDDSGNTWGTAHPLQNAEGAWIGGVWRVPLSNGGTRTITWRHATGAITITDRRGGAATTTQLQAGDVVPLVPGTLADKPRTLDKAVSFDLPTEAFVRVIIFPRLNETYIDFVHGPPMTEKLPYGAAAKYGLVPVGHWNGKLPVTASGGTWTTHLPGRLTRVVSWHAGDSFVTVTDTTAAGTTTTRVPIGHELPLVPFK